MEMRTGGQAMKVKARLRRVSELPPTLSDLGISHRQSSNFQKMAGLSEERFVEHIARIRDSDDGELTTQGVLLLAQAGCIIPGAATR